MGSFATAYFGIQTYDRSVFVKTQPETAHFKPVIDGTHITRYGSPVGAEFVDFRPEAIKSGGRPEVYEQPRVGVRQIGKSPIATYLPPGLYTLNTIYNVHIVRQPAPDLKFVLGLVCSRAVAWFWSLSFFDQKETFPKIKKDALLSVPVPVLDQSSPSDRTRHDQMVKLVDQMLDGKKQWAAAKTDRDKAYWDSKCAALDRQIDRLVYELYGLTEDEIKIVEGVEG